MNRLSTHLIIFLACAFVLLLGSASIGNASLIFESVVDWDTSNDRVADQLGRTAIRLSGSGSPFVFEYTHGVTFDPPATSVGSASITLSHNDNSATGGGEFWIISTVGDFKIGELETSNDGAWHDQMFVLPERLYDGISGGSWYFAIKLTENTSGTDRLWIDKSVLSGTYAPVPIPATALLFGSALLCLVGIRMRRKDA